MKIDNGSHQEKIRCLEEIVEVKNKEILRRLDSEEKTLLKYIELIEEYTHLEAKYNVILKKYELLSRSKLGKLTLLYWKWKNRVPRDF
ncbi:hypothetical protein [Paenibacillus dendritiformis]|uniref:Uncharacterized protein n=1 Tax=Paenibacillus dendritiformis C454 TaxID=1131935 RepID=H3S9L9_9BACL|nr:hypothetical protein [Paenibacillus dendritiformis]EHQ64137.1 hypothetical protein PDENDC454_00990 [Paenibacillus dendritiformis C454]CAH8773276.1 hypothetical protein H7S4_006054 [Paenibacillus dendritiformis]